MAVTHSSDQRRRGLRTAPLFWAAYLSITLSGCWATKKDVRTLQMDLAALRTRQDSLSREATRQNRVLQDSLSSISEATRYMQGNLSNQIKSLQELVLTVQQLLGQSQQRITELRDQLDRAAQQQQQQQQATQPVRPGGNSAEELYQAGMDNLQTSPGRARAAFQALLSEFPISAQAPDAQFYLAETYVAEKDTAQAFREFEKVAAGYSSAPRAPEALFRAGVVAEENRARARARAFYNRVVKDYPNSDAAKNARARLSQMPRN